MKLKFKIEGEGSGDERLMRIYANALITHASMGRIDTLVREYLSPELRPPERKTMQGDGYLELIEKELKQGLV